MAETLINDVLNGGMPSVFPSRQELEAWNSLSREKQIKRFQAVLGSADCNTASDVTMEDIKKGALGKLSAKDK